jgi:hypothetical protein
MISVFAGWAPGVIVCFGVPLMLIAALVLRVARRAVVEWIAFAFLALTAVAIIVLLAVSALDNWLLWLLVGPLIVITGWGLLTGYRQKFGSRSAN